MAYTDIDKPTDYFNTVLWTGNSGTNAIATGHATDMVWLKWRGGSNNHQLQDIIRGVTKPIFPNTTGAESTASPSITAFTSTGFTLGNDGGDYNDNGREYVGWSWNANGSGSSNGTGSITATVSANTTSGFSIVKWTGNGTSGATVGHGLGAAPKIVLIKKYSAGDAWTMLNTNISLNTYLALNSSSGAISDPVFNNTAPTSTLFTLDSDGQVNDNGASIIAYCFAEKKGYSKFGSYTGNGNSDGTFVYTGFKPAFVMTKRSNSSENWYMLDNKRSPFNPPINALSANLTNAEDTNATGRTQDFLSNGFKLRTSDTAVNGSGDTYIYMAFAENPFVTSTGVPACAR